MAMKRTNKALPEVIPPRICLTCRPASFWFRLKTSNMWVLSTRAGNTINTMSGSHDNFSENHENHEMWPKLDPYSTSLAENQAFWIFEVLRSQWDRCRPQKLPYKIQNRQKNQWTSLGKVYTKLFRQPYALVLPCPQAVTLIPVQWVLSPIVRDTRSMNMQLWSLLWIYTLVGQ